MLSLLFFHKIKTTGEQLIESPLYFAFNFLLLLKSKVLSIMHLNIIDVGIFIVFLEILEHSFHYLLWIIFIHICLNLLLNRAIY